MGVRNIQTVAPHCRDSDLIGLRSGPGIGIFKSSRQESDMYPKDEIHSFPDWLNVSLCGAVGRTPVGKSAPASLHFLPG